MAAEPDLLIAGGGPAGCAAAVMASSLGLRSVLVEPGPLGGRVAGIPRLSNVVGGVTTGPDLAARLATDVARSELCRVHAGRVATVRAGDAGTVAALEDGSEIRAPHAVVATGLRAQWLDEADWIDDGGRLILLPRLAELSAAELDGADAVVLGVDCPLGTVLRAYPAVAMRLTVLYPPAEAYKAAEVAGDARVELVPVDRAVDLGELLATAYGSGAEAALTAYYARAGVVRP